MKPQPARRRGVVLIVALVCLSVATAMVISTTRHALDARRGGRSQHQLRQTEYLLQAGIRRAVAGLSQSSDYAGETWQPAAALPGFDVATVHIEVVQAEDQGQSHQVTVRAQLGRGDSPANRIQRSYTFPAHRVTD